MTTATRIGALALIGLGGVGAATAAWSTGAMAAGKADRVLSALIAEGESLFQHTWSPGDARAGGDGLGPAYNDVSCVACHSGPSIGGSGDASKDVRLLVGGGLARVLFKGVVDEEHGRGALELERAAREEIEVAVGTLRGFGRRPLSEVRRNTPALYGAGLIDQVPEEAVRALAIAQLGSPLSGRPGEDQHGRLARFGWKGDVADLRTFVAQACANELGLSTPVTAQRDAAGTPDPTAAVDLGQRQLDGLVAYVSSLPEPVSSLGYLGPHPGEALFVRIGCGGCHVKDVGPAKGVYSDLLLHDMGDGLREGSAAGSYGRRVVAGANMASAREWRTPPLWGVADSAPYLHDGRVDTLEGAIFAHDGEAALARDRYRKLLPGARRALVGFLRSLQAPEET